MNRSAAVLLSLLMSIGAAAQQRPPFGEKIEVKLIEIDVVVTDAGGKRIYGLTPADFEVFEGRRKQEITNFSEYRRDAAAIAGPRAPQAALTPPEPHALLLLIDSLPRERLVRSTVFRDLEPLVAKLMRKGDRAGLIFWEPGYERARTILEPTTDLAAVQEAVRRLGGVSTAGTTTNIFADLEKQFIDEGLAAQAAVGMKVDVEGNETTTANFSATMELMHFRRKTRAFSRLVSSFGAGPGRKSVLYVSQSFGMPTTPGERLSALSHVEELTRSANAAGVTFYAIRPAPPAPPGEEKGGDDKVQNELASLRHLTEPTGGLLDFGLKSVETLGATLADDIDSYYSIAYRASSDGSDRERRITVKPKDRRYRVRSRQSFVEKSDETLARETVLGRLFDAEGGKDLLFGVAEKPRRRTTRGRWLLPFDVKIPADQLEYAAEGRDQVALVKILIVASNGLSEVTSMHEDELRVVAGKNTRDGFVWYSAELLLDNRGSEVSIGVFDRRSGLVGVQTLDTRTKVTSAR